MRSAPALSSHYQLRGILNSECLAGFDLLTNINSIFGNIFHSFANLRLSPFSTGFQISSIKSTN